MFGRDDSGISAERKKRLIAFAKSQGLKFSDLSLLDLAFHHRSFSNENASHKRLNNERLEFLGDSVLGLSTADFLYNDMAGHPEGDLAKIKSAVVSEQSLGPLGLAMGIDSCLVLGRGEEMSGGRTKRAILADAVEAVIGAVYLDQGYAAAEKFVLSFIVPEIRKYQQDKGSKDYKSLLQEFCQREYKECPVYTLVRSTGPEHDRVFYIAVRFNGMTYGPAQGKNKKTAEQNAARLAYNAVAVC